MQLRHISPRSIDWVDAMDEGAGGNGWEKLGPEERAKLRHQVQYRGRDLDQFEESQGSDDGQGFEAETRSPSR